MGGEERRREGGRGEMGRRGGTAIVRLLAAELPYIRTVAISIVGSLAPRTHSQ